MEREHLSLEIIDFIRNEIGEFNMVIDTDNSIEVDLGVTGDDAIDLIKKFSKKFKVDIDNFSYKKYFYPEPNLFNDFSNGISILTIENLVNAVKIGKLE